MLSWIQQSWGDFRKYGYWLAIATMAFAVDRIVPELYRLVWRSDKLAAIDLKQRYREVTAWFSGQPVYNEIHTAVYPPASYGMMRPLLDYSSLMWVRWLWAFLTLILLALLVYWLVRESQAQGWLERTFIALIPLSVYATSETIGNGQLSIHGLVAVVVGFGLLYGQQWGWSRRLLVSSVLILALVKPTLTLPFFWIVIVVPKRTLLQRFGIWAMVSIGYLAIAWWAGLYQDGNLLTLHTDWLHQGISGANWGSTGGGADLRNSTKAAVGYGNIHDWLGALGLSRWNLPASLIMLLITGGVVFIYRTVDVWILLGICAVVARLWTYHLVYDDLLAVLPLIALFRLTKTQSHNPYYQTLSGVLFGVAWGISLMPAEFRLMAFPFNAIFRYGQVSIWLIMMLFLLSWAQRLKSRDEIEAVSHSPIISQKAS